MNDLIKKQLDSVQVADLSHFNPEDNSYFIPQRKTVKLEVNHAYLIYLKDSFFYNEIVIKNWNNNQLPVDRYLKVEINQVMAKMIKVMSIGYDFLNKIDTNKFWSGWIDWHDIDVLATL